MMVLASAMRCWIKQAFCYTPRHHNENKRCNLGMNNLNNLIEWSGRSLSTFATLENGFPDVAANLDTYKSQTNLSLGAITKNTKILIET